MTSEARRPGHPGAAAREPARERSRGPVARPAARTMEPARAPFAGRRSPRAGRAPRGGPRGGRDRGRGRPARAAGRGRRSRSRWTASGWRSLPGHPPADAPLVCLDTETTGLATAAGTLAFLVGLARWEGDHVPPGPAAAPGPRGRAGAPGRDRPLGHARRLARDLQRPGVRLAADRGPLPARRSAAPRRTPGTWTCCRSCAACSSTGWRMPGCGASRRSSSGSRASATSRAGRSRRSTWTCCAAAHRAARRRRHPQREGRPLARPAARPRRAPLRGPGRTPRRPARRPRGPGPGLCAGPPPRRGARVPGRRARRPPAGAGPVRADRGRACGSREAVARGARRLVVATCAAALRGPGARPGWRGDLANGRGGPLGPSPSAAAWDTPSDRWTDERLAAERARTLRRLGRWAEAAEAWQAAAAAGGGLGAIAWIEVAKLREHKLDDPGGALAATARPGGCSSGCASPAGTPTPGGRPPAARTRLAARIRRRSPPRHRPGSVRVVAAVHSLDGVREVRDAEDTRALRIATRAPRQDAGPDPGRPARGDDRLPVARQRTRPRGTCRRRQPVHVFPDRIGPVPASRSAPSCHACRPSAWTPLVNSIVAPGFVGPASSSASLSCRHRPPDTDHVGARTTVEGPGSRWWTGAPSLARAACPASQTDERIGGRRRPIPRAPRPEPARHPGLGISPSGR